MNRVVLLAVCLITALGGCDDGLFRANREPDIVVRCKTVVEGTAANRVVRYKPIEVVKGNVDGEMLDGDGFLNYAHALEEDEDVGEIYIFKLWDVPEEIHPTQHGKYPFGFNCEMSVEIELPNGKGITE